MEDSLFPFLDEEEEERKSLYNTPASPDAQTTVLSLPTELLLEIMQLLKFQDVFSLTSVNSLFHAVATTRFYSVVALHPTHFTKDLAARFSDNIRETTLEDMIPYFTCKHSSILRGLLARPEHSNALQTFIVCSAPNWKARDELTITNTLLRGIIARATRLKYLKLPHLGQEGDERPFLSLNGIECSQTLSTVALWGMDLNDWNEILQYLPGLKELGLTAGYPYANLQDSTTKLKNIEKLKCSITLDSHWEIQNWTFTPNPTPAWSEPYRIIPELLPNLKELILNHISQYYARHTPESTVFELMHSGLSILLPRLPSLQRLTYRKLINPSDHTNYDSEWITKESGEIQTFSRLCPTLLRVTILSANPQIFFGRRHHQETKCTITWKRSSVGDDSIVPLSSVTSNSTRPEIWTPDPTTESRWWWWYGKFVTVDSMHRAMVHHWKGEAGVMIPPEQMIASWARVNSVSLMY